MSNYFEDMSKFDRINSELAHYENSEMSVHEYLESVRKILSEKPKTNADKIRAMSDEELAEFLREVKEDYQWANPEYPDLDDTGEWVEWLQLEMEEEE